jgi:hypothetical protein
MHFDEQGKKMLDESIIKCLSDHINHLEYIYTCYIQENIDNKS